MGEGDWKTSPDYAISGSYYHESMYAANPSGLSSHYHGFNSTSAQFYEQYTTHVNVQYIWLTEGKVPQEIMIQYFIDGKWRRAYWGGDGNGNDMINTEPAHGLSAGVKFRVGDVPQVTGQWIQLTVRLYDLGITGSTTYLAYGVIYGLYGGTARWDFTATMSRGLQVNNLSPGQEVRFEFKSDKVWDVSKGASANPNVGDDNYWLDATYDDEKYYSSPTSIKLNFSNSPMSYDTGVASRYRYFSIGSISTISMRVYLSGYSHGGGSGDVMDCGVRMSLYDTSETNYATYTYWLACWSGSTDNRTPPSNTKVIWGKPPVGTWLNVVRNPSADWPIDWSTCAKVKVELYFYTSYAYGDLFKMFIDNFAITDSSGAKISDTFEGSASEFCWAKVGSGATYAILDPYQSHVRTFPVTGQFKIYSGATVIAESPWMSNIYNIDTFGYYPTRFYVNDVKGPIHDRAIGSLTYQDEAKKIIQEQYLKYDNEGGALKTRTSLGANWVYSQAGYDEYGSMLWSTDPTGRSTINEYKATTSDWSTYVNATRQGWRIDTFDTDDSWTRSASSGWLTAAYSTSMATSPDRSTQISFTGAPQGTDTGAASAWKEYTIVNPVQAISVQLYCAAYYHAAGWPNVLDAGIRMRLYDSGGANYATYTYWLACWSGSTDNRSAPDANTKVIYGKPTLSVWKNPVLYPNTDFPSINWASCAKVRFELYAYTSYAYQDYLTLYFDDFSYDDFVTSSKTTYTYDINTGNLLYSVEPLGRVTRYQYDELGRMTRVTNPDNSYRTMTYDDVNNKATATDELGHKTVTSFDKIGRMIKVERWGSGTSAYSYVTYTYNWQDKVASFTDERGHVTTCTYDYLGRQTRTTNPDLTYSTVAYDDANRLVTYCSYTSGNAQTHKTVMVKDLLGRLNATREFTTSTAYNETLMTYNAVGNLLTVRDAKMQVTRMAYDSLDRLTRTTYPDSLFETATYDAAGRTLTKTDREGNVTTSSYDSAGNLVKVASPSDTISRSYDAAGQLLQLKSTLGTISYAYDTRGWVKSLTEIIGSNSYQVRLGYDSEGKQTWVLYPSGLNVSYGYDSYDRVTAVTKQPSTTLLTITYNLDDTIATETTGDGTKVTTYAYNSRDWVTGINMKLSGTIKLVLLYSYDDVGNVKQLVVNTTYKASTAKTETYAYDWLDRLRSASGGSLPSGLTYKYDTVGNRISKGSVTYTYGSYNQLTGDGTWNYNHDGNGNEAWKTKSTEKWNYQFSSLDQLTKVVKGTKSGQTWTWTTQGEYWYDANGAMAKSLQGGVTTEYVYLGHDPLCEKSTGVFTDYIYVNGHMAAKQTGSDVYYYIRDALGSTRLVYSGTSQVFSVATYAPFGTPVGVSGTDQKWKYAGEMLVGAAGTSPGLYYIGARWMDPELGRFVSLDPQLGKLSSPQTLDRYVYCVNNPLRFTDPTGEGFWSGASKWWDKNWQTIALVAVCAAITIGTGGAGAGLAVAVAYGVFAGASTNVALAYLQSGGQLTLQGAVSAAVSGAITGGLGAITAGVGSGAISLGGSLGARIAGSTFARLGAAAGIGALGGEGSYLAGEATKMAVTGGREGKITLRGMLFSAAAGTATGFMTGGLKSLGYKPGLDDFPEMNYPQAMKAMLPGAFFTAVMSTLKYSARPWTEGDRALTFGAQAMMPTFQGG